MPDIAPNQIRSPLDETSPKPPDQEVNFARSAMSFTHGKANIQPLNEAAAQQTLANQPPVTAPASEVKPNRPSKLFKRHNNSRAEGTVDANPFKLGAVGKFAYCLVAWLWVMSAFFIPRYKGFRQIGWGLLAILIAYILFSSVKSVIRKR